jgi:glutamyl-tRNA reductase
MKLVAVGLSHHTAPVDLRERMAVPSEAVAGTLAGLRAAGVGREGVLVSTCNRVELYAVPEEGRSAHDLAHWFLESRGLRLRSVGPHVYVHEQEEALRHLFRVTSSLDSMIVGEPQILGQVKEAYRVAAERAAAGPVMHRVMDSALRVAKRVRTETDIGREAVSVGRAGVELARQVLGDLAGRSALLVGAGAHGKLVARTLLSHGLGELVVANRTFSRASDLAGVFGGSAIHMEEVPRYLERVDLVLASTAAGRVLIDRATLAPVVRKRRFRALVLIDLSVPRNIDPACNSLEGVYRFDVDDLTHLASQGVERRRAAAEVAERIVAEESGAAWRTLQVEQVHDRLGRAMRRAEAVRAAELARLEPLLARLDERERRSVDAATRAIVKKILHPSLALARARAEAGDLDGLDALLDGLAGELAAPATPRGDAPDDD